MTDNNSEKRWETIHKLINDAHRIVFSTHVNPDGDGLGSQAALYHFLTAQGKICRILNPSSLPEEYKFLGERTKFELYESPIHSSWIHDADLAIIFDVGDYGRLNQIGDDLKLTNIPTLSIDHHPHSCMNRFRYEIHDTSAPATGYLIYEYIKYTNKLSGNGVGLTDVMSQGLYIALMTDTGSFRFNNTSAEAHEMASELIRNGLKPYDLYQKVYESSSIERIRLLALALQTIHLEHNGKLAWFLVTQEMIKSANARNNDISGFADFVRTIRGVEVSMMIHELNSDRCRINFRSKGKIRIDDLARKLGGGGHAFAAGTTVDLPLEQCMDYVVSEALDEINSQINQDIQS